MLCGPFPGPGALIAVVGPNGCGKSVIGDAIAFVLGGNRKMLRAAGGLSALVNQHRIAQGKSNAKASGTLSDRLLYHERTCPNQIIDQPPY